MYDLKGYYFCSNMTFQNNTIIALILKAMTCKRQNQKIYKTILNAVKDEKVIKKVKVAYNIEENHYKIFQKIYAVLTGKYMDISLPNIKIKNSLTEIFKNILRKNSEELKLYRRIGYLAPTKEIKNVLYKLINDRQEYYDIFTFAYSRYVENCDTDSFLRIDMSVTTIPKEITETKKYISEDLRIPTFHGIKNSKVQTQINNSIENDIMEFKKQLEESSEEYGMEAEKAGKAFKPYIISNNYNVTYNKNNILSVSILYHEYINGRHSYIRSTYNYDLVTGKSLGLKDLFKPESHYKDLINEEIRNQLILNKSLYPPGAAQKFKGIAEDQPFYLENGNIVLFFGFNEIAPTVSEIPIIRIPFSKFKNDIRPEFLI